MTTLPTHKVLCAAAIITLAAACVPKSKHEETLNELAGVSQEYETTASTLAEANERIANLEAVGAERNHRLDICEASIRNTIRDTEERQRLLDEARAELIEVATQLELSNSELNDANRALGVERSARVNTEEQLAAGQSERAALMERIERLNQIEAEAREQNRIYQDMLGRFQALIDAGQLSISIENGRMVLNLPQDILFDPGSARVGDEGRSALSSIARVLAEFPDRRFQVEGHTDNVPISTSRFPSNWHLSAARALSVVEILQENGCYPGNLSGAGYGEFRPRAGNDTREERALNRRIEIVMVPNLDIITTP